MSFSEKVHNRLLALESQVQALDRRLKALEPQVAISDVRWTPVKEIQLTPVAPKRGPGRPKKVVNG